jgi:hypothetical protein
MADTDPGKRRFNVFCIGQAGRLGYEAVIFAATFRAANPGFPGRLFIGEPQPGPNWQADPRMTPEIRALLEGFEAEILPFDTPHFGQVYPYGNKIEGLFALPEGEPFVFFDTDTLLTGPLTSVGFDFDRPSASMRREATWPQIELYGPGYAATWKSLYDKFGLDFESSLDLTQPDEYWERYLYFNAGWFFYRCPRTFGQRFLDYALPIRDDGPEELVCQSLDPWLDQVALPLVIHSFGGGRPGPGLSGLDGGVSCHYRTLPLLYARESDATVAMLEGAIAPNLIKKVLKEYEPLKKLVYQGKGHKIRAMFDRGDLPRREQAIRNQIKQAKLWLR